MLSGVQLWLMSTYALCFTIWLSFMINFWKVRLVMKQFSCYGLLLMYSYVYQTIVNSKNQQTGKKEKMQQKRNNKTQISKMTKHKNKIKKTHPRNKTNNCPFAFFVHLFCFLDFFLTKKITKKRNKCKLDKSFFVFFGIVFFIYFASCIFQFCRFVF